MLVFMGKVKVVTFTAVYKFKSAVDLSGVQSRRWWKIHWDLGHAMKVVADCFIAHDDDGVHQVFLGPSCGKKTIQQCGVNMAAVLDNTFG